MSNLNYKNLIYIISMLAHKSCVTGATAAAFQGGRDEF